MFGKKQLETAKLNKIYSWKRRGDYLFTPFCCLPSLHCCLSLDKNACGYSDIQVGEKPLKVIRSYPIGEKLLRDIEFTTGMW